MKIMKGARVSLLLLIGVLCCLVAMEKAVGLEFTRSDFPSDFVFGSATSAYQVSIFSIFINFYFFLNLVTFFL
jgi:hypothetical protein